MDEATDPPLLALRGISKSFLGTTVLEGIDLDCRAGEVHAIVGENGAGKSTLMKIMSGIYTEYEGEMLLAGEPVSFRNTREAIDSGVAMIHQELNLVPELSVYDNVLLAQATDAAGNTSTAERTITRVDEDGGVNPVRVWGQTRLRDPLDMLK